jgi:hypothetical protein
VKRSRGIQKLSTGKYRVQIRYQGFANQSAIFDSEKEAKKWRDKKLSAIKLDLETAHESAAETISLSDLIGEYLDEKHIDQNSTKYGQLKWWNDRLGHLRLSKLQPADIAKALRDFERTDKKLGGKTIRKANGVKPSPATINRYKASLSSVLSTAEREWHYISDNPCRKIKSWTEKNERNRWLTEECSGQLIPDTLLRSFS